MCREAPGELLDLEHLGVTFHRDEEGRLGTRAFGGASAARTYYVADITGQAILHVLYEQLMKFDEVHRYEEWFTTALVQDEDGRIAGAITRNIRDGAIELFSAKAVILATGGNGQLYDPTTNALICTGDGIAMAYRIGAPLMDMEMIQYHPTTLAGLGLLITEGARGEGAHLYNAQGERFMEKYAPNKMELASRDVVSRAEQTEINEGRGFPDGTVALDITVVPRKRIHEALREIVNVGRDFAGRGHHARADPHQARQPLHDGRHPDRRRRPDLHPGPLRRRRVRLRVGPRRQPPRRQLAARHARLRPPLGQARRRGRARSAAARPRVRAAARTRRRASRRSSTATAAAGASARSRPSWARRWTSTWPSSATRQGCAPRSRRCGGSRRRPPTSRSTTRAAVFNQDVLGALELQFMLDNAEAIVLSAIERKESRGAQFRTDFPERNDDDWLKHINVSANGSEPEISYSEVTMTQWEPQERTY